MVVCLLVRIRNVSSRTFHVHQAEDPFYTPKIGDKHFGSSRFEIPPGFNESCESLVVPWSSTSMNGLKIVEADSGLKLRCTVGPHANDSGDTDWLRLHDSDWKSLDEEKASSSGRGRGRGAGRGGGRGGRGGAPAEDYRLFVTGLAYSVTDEVLRRDFEECGELTDVKLLKDKVTGESKGIAYLTFKDKAGFDSALEYDGEEYGGRKLRVQKAEAKGSGRGSAGPGVKPNGCISVVVKGLAEDVTKSDLETTFKDCGNGPSNVGLLMDKATGKSRCTARIDFGDDGWGVEEAIKLNGSDLKGKPMVMTYCKPPQAWQTW